MMTVDWKMIFWVVFCFLFLREIQKIVQTTDK